MTAQLTNLRARRWGRLCSLQRQSSWSPRLAPYRSAAGRPAGRTVEPIHTRRRSTRRAAARGAVERADARHAADAPRRCRRRSSRRRSPPKTGASGGTSASIRWRSCARSRPTLLEGRVAEGGSTITQQVAKLLLNRATPVAIAGHRREDARGRDRAAAGAPVHQARDPRALSESGALRQSVCRRRARQPRLLRRARRRSPPPRRRRSLPALPQRPSGFNPYRRRDAALRRQRTVLRRMGGRRCAHGRAGPRGAAPSA